MSIQRAEILDRACQLFLEEGLEGFTMRRLAGRLGVTAPAIYRHYASKEAVLTDVVEEAYGRMSTYLRGALEGDSPGGRFRRAGDGYLAFALENPRLYQVLYASPEMMGVEDISELRERHGAALEQFWHDRVRECMDAGLLREADPGDVALTLWAHAHGLIALYLQGMLETDEAGFRELYRSSHRRALRGLAGEGPGAWTAAGDAGAAGAAT